MDKCVRVLCGKCCAEHELQSGPSRGGESNVGPGFDQNINCIIVLCPVVDTACDGPSKTLGRYISLSEVLILVPYIKYCSHIIRCNQAVAVNLDIQR